MMAPQVLGSCTLLMVSLNLFNFSLGPAAENYPRVLFLWPASFLLPAESACAEVGLRFLDASQTSCSAPLQIAHVYLENNLCSTKGKKNVFCDICKRTLQEDDVWIPALERKGAGALWPGMRARVFRFGIFKIVMPSVLSWCLMYTGACGAWNEGYSIRGYTLCFPYFCVLLLWLRLCPWYHSLDSHFSPLKCLIFTARDPILYLQPYHPGLRLHWINNWSLNLLDFDLISALPVSQIPCPCPTSKLLLYCCQEPVQMCLLCEALLKPSGNIQSHFDLSQHLTHFFSLFTHSLLWQVLLITYWVPDSLRRWTHSGK